MCPGLRTPLRVCRHTWKLYDVYMDLLNEKSSPDAISGSLQDWEHGKVEICPLASIIAQCWNMVMLKYHELKWGQSSRNFKGEEITSVGGA